MLPGPGLGVLDRVVGAKDRVGARAVCVHGDACGGAAWKVGCHQAGARGTPCAGERVETHRYSQGLQLKEGVDISTEVE